MRENAIVLVFSTLVLLSAQSSATPNPGFDPTIPLFAGGIWNTVADARCPAMSLNFFQGRTKERGTVTISYNDHPEISGGGMWTLKGHLFTIKTYMDTLHGTVSGKTITATYRSITDGKQGPQLSCNFTTE